MFCSMGDKSIMSKWQKFSIFWQQGGQLEVYSFYQHYQLGKKALQVSVLIIEYSVATSYELWMI